MTKKKEIALVLSSGGARGFAHIGVIKSLEKNGYKIKSISGASMGALVGGLYATGQLYKFEEWARNLDKREVLKLVDITLTSSGLIKGEKLIHELENLIPKQNIKDLEIPYCAVATDILNEKEIVFRSGNLYNAIRASIAIPTVLKPFKIGDIQLIDGGVVNPIPSNRIKRHKGDKLFVANVNGRTPVETPVETYKEQIGDNPPAPVDIEIEEQDKQFFTRVKDQLSKMMSSTNQSRIGYFNLVNKSTSLMLQTISEHSLKETPPDLLFNIPRKKFGTFDFDKAGDIIDFGESFADDVLKDFKN
ncbi:MAG: patatin-like phospholipase family protein [Bacteroidales bacterium]|jgi:NTE family protein|nr:patatin-like phospholipase family protein [Bacteroidales bacterium]